MEDFCLRPYKFFEIGSHGECYFCCKMWIHEYCLGNILEQSFDEIWNGEKAQKFRQSILDNKYEFCDRNLCIIPEKKNFVSPVADYPEEVSLCYDNTCVQQCVYCRDEPHVMSKEEIEKWDALIEPVLIPLMKNAKLVTVNVAGEVFISEHSKKLIKRVAEVYPDIKFAIITNGILCSEENLKKLGIADKIQDIRISIPSCIEETYNKIVRNGNFQKVMKNLEYISELKKQGKIQVFLLNCVLSSLNYKDLIPMAKLAQKLGACVHIMPVQNMGQDTAFLRQFEKYSIVEKSHPEYNQFVKIIKNPLIKDNPNISINDYFKNLQPVPFLTFLKNKITFYKKYGFTKN